MTHQKKAGLAWAVVIFLFGLIVAATVDGCLKKHGVSQCDHCG